MKEITFPLEGAPYVELDKLLKSLRLAESGGQAHAMIALGLVTRGEAVEMRKRAKLRAGDRIVLSGRAAVTVTE